MRRATFFPAVVALLTLWGALASGQELTSGPVILAKTDDAATRSADFTASVEIKTVDTDGQTTVRVLDVWQKGAERRLVKITAPPRLRGVGMLSKGAGELYLYLPAFRKTRRIAGRRRGERFVGSNFTQDDLSRTRYGSRFDATLTGGDETHWTLRLNPRDPEDEPSHHLVIRVRKADFGIARVEVFDKAHGSAVRTVDASDFRAVGDMVLAHTVVARDLRSGSVSTATLTKVHAGAGLADSLFTKRQLER